MENEDEPRRKSTIGFVLLQIVFLCVAIILILFGIDCFIKIAREPGIVNVASFSLCSLSIW